MSKNSLYRQARKAYRQDELGRILMLPERKFGRAFGMETIQTAKPSYRTHSGRPEDYYHFRDNGSHVLAVAHLDTVVRPDRRAPRFRTVKSGPFVVSGALDDRLGAYVILKMLPKLGITCDWLLTVGEESGCSTADSFSPPKDYDHVIEFDRGGTDVVMYQYEDQAGREAVAAAGATMGQGSFSDIAYLEHLDVKCFNWGVGYEGNYHSEQGYAFLSKTFAMVAKYLRFHEQNAGIAMPHEPDRSYRYGSGPYSYRDDDACYACDVCGRRAVDPVTWYCRECGACADCGLVQDDGCLCYVPERVREEIRAGGYVLDSTDEDAGADEDESGRPADAPAPWQGMTWAEYLATRPSPGAAARPAITDSWHATTGTVLGHLAGPDWASSCLRCAARWPHPIAAAGGAEQAGDAGDAGDVPGQADYDAQVAAEDERQARAGIS